MSPLGFLTLAALCGAVVCQDPDYLYITADNVLKEVCINDNAIGPLLYPGIVGKIDKLALPSGWNAAGDGCLTVKAYNTKATSWPGILGCITSSSMFNLLWQCVEVPQLAGMSCCSSCSNPVWGLQSSFNLFQYLPNENHNRDFVKKLPPYCTAVKGFTQWVWDNKRLQPNVCCRAKGCAVNCDSCELTGPTLCDPGKCRFGFTSLSAPPICNLKCHIIAKTFDDSNPPMIPQVSIINSGTGSEYVVPITMSQAAFWLDLVTCQPGALFQTNDPSGTTQQTNMWSYDSTLTGDVLVDIASGTNFGLIWMGIQQLDGNGGYVDTSPPIYSPSIRKAELDVFGYQSAVSTQTVSNVVTA
jgi:hypothetical protein